MYFTHFGLTQPPFKITPNTAFFYGGGNRGAVLDALIYALSQGEGIIKITGEVGSGKTMLCRMLATKLPLDIETIYLANPSISPEDVLHAIVFELQLPVPAGASRQEITHILHDYLLERHKQGKQVVVLVEEAQGMPLATLEEIRLLSNLETEQAKLLQIVLFGQPELNESLNLQSMRQLKERITHSFPLGPLTPEETKEYLSFRLRAAGYHGPDLFNPAVVNFIAKHAMGLTRRINIIADKTLLAAYSEGTHNITLKHAQAAVKDSEFGNLPGQFPWRMAATIVLSVITTLGLAYALKTYQPTPPASAPAVTPTASPQSPAANAVQPPQANNAANEKAKASPPLAPADILEARIAATPSWLDQQKPDALAIQLIGSNNPEMLKSYLHEISQSIEIDNVFVYRTIARGNPSFTIIYSNFASRREAAEALANLPAKIKQNRPILRTVKGIRAELGQK
ncbi:AAA family ATPase [Sulfurirhabdus autotrophica]|uniref:Type II secretory pathway predicted ATPase ExeA n=1 Tax=Sulfurirhabdus autotrophica TaxID=1706046 RepID=A0A4R3XS25_9PROT|nr:AAA family ATPase [Sulfurirhabdus autotrophica]TCV80067.1 type II secretory pathway predicted ATPase ExeA [Sulfurirhabdus autotrophica]